MAIVTIAEYPDNLGYEVARKTSQRLGFVLVDSVLISGRVGSLQSLDEKELSQLLLQRVISPQTVKRLIIEHALGNNVILFNLGGEILFHRFPGAIHVKVFSASDRKDLSRSSGKKEDNYLELIKELYGSEEPGGDFYDLQIKVEGMDTDLVADLIVKAAEMKGITAKAGVTWRALKKLRNDLVKRDLSSLTDHEAKMPSFAHPSEMDFAKVLDFYRVRWEYEPRSFPIEWNEEGNVIQEFTPDFYLPELDLYIELTTLKQSLITKKNRKVKRLKELYPDVNIKVFYRRDYKRLLKRFGIGDKKEGSK